MTMTPLEIAALVALAVLGAGFLALCVRDFAAKYVGFQPRARR